MVGSAMEGGNGGTEADGGREREGARLPQAGGGAEKDGGRDQEGVCAAV